MRHYKREEINIDVITKIADTVRNYYRESKEKDIDKINEKYNRRRRKKRN